MARRTQQDTQYWAEHITRQHACGLGVREYCRRERLQVHNFYYWRRRVPTVVPTSRERRQLSSKPARPTATSQQSVADPASHSPNDHSKTVVIRLGDYATVHVPAAMLETIEAVLKMAMSACQPSNQPTGSAFRSVVVHS